MKKYILALMIVCPIVFAGEWLESGNKDGGKILLLSNKCSDKSDDTGRYVIASTASGKSISGCWYFFADMIHVVWVDGTTYSYRKEVFEYRKDEK